MTTISTDDLDRVTGGATPTGSSACTSNDQLLTSLQSIQRSLDDLGKNQQGGLFGGNNMLLFTMALAMQRRTEVVVYGGRRCRRGW